MKKEIEKKLWKQERPSWCPHPNCLFVRRVQDSICGGNLSEPEPHDADLNIYRICINTDDTCESLLVNKTDLGYFRWIFDALDGLKTSWLSKHE